MESSTQHDADDDQHDQRLGTKSLLAALHEIEVLPPQSSRNKFLSTFDLLCYLGLQIKNRQTLRSLCLVSREFNQAFTPALYAELRFLYNESENFLPLFDGDYEEWPGRPLRFPTHMEHIRHTKLLSVQHGTFPGEHEWPIWNAMHPLHSEMRILLESAPTLKTFQYIGPPLSNETLQTLYRSCSRLENLCLLYSARQDPYYDDSAREYDEYVVESAPEDDVDQQPYRSQNFPSFKNLTSLRLEGMFGDLQPETWTATVLKLLKVSPKLQELSLSLDLASVWYMTDHHPEASINVAHKSWIFFFQNLCNAYGATGAQPLKLRSLHMGCGMLLWGDDGDPPESLSEHRAHPYFSDHPPAYLAKLTNLEYLEEVHMHNDDYWVSSYDAPAREPTNLGMLQLVICVSRDPPKWNWYHGCEPLAWGAFQPQFAPRLRRLTCSTSTPLFKHLLGQMSGEVAAGLAVSHVYNIDASVPEREFGDLGYRYTVDTPVEWDVREHGHYDYQALDRLSSADEDVLDRPMQGFRMIRVDLRKQLVSCDRLKMLDDLVAAQAQTLAGLSINLGQHVSEAVFGPYLKRLPKLMQLVVEDKPDVWCSPTSADQESSPPPRQEDPRLRAVVTELVSWSTSLRYVKVGFCAWEVVRSVDGRTRMLDMDVNEMAEIELFCFATRSRDMVLGV